MVITASISHIPTCDSTSHLYFVTLFTAEHWAHLLSRLHRIFLYENTKIKSLWCFVSNRFKNVIFEISPTEEVGDFEVKAKFMGVQMETFMLHYQVGLHQVKLIALRMRQLCSCQGRKGEKSRPRWGKQPTLGSELSSECQIWSVWARKLLQMYVFSEHTWSFHLGLPLNWTDTLDVNKLFRYRFRQYKIMNFFSSLKSFLPPSHFDLI